MNEERLNPYFDINAKYEDMILRGKSIVEHYLSVSDGDGEAPDYICLAYDVKNYLPKLQQENQQLQNNWNELKEYLKKIIEECGVPIRQYYTEHVLGIMQKIESRKGNKENERFN